MKRNIRKSTKEGNLLKWPESKENTLSDYKYSADSPYSELHHYTSILNQIHDAIIGTDLHACITIWNKGAERLFGYTRDEIIGRPIYLLHPEEKFAFSTEDVTQLIRDKDNIEFEVQMKHKSGRIFYVHSSLSKLIDNNGNINGIISYTIDITARRKAEEQLHKTNRALSVLSQCNQAVGQAKNEQALLNEICKIIIKYGGYQLTAIAFAEHDKRKTMRVAAKSGSDTDYLTSINVTWADNKFGRGPWGTAIRTRKPYIVENIKTDPNFSPWRKDAFTYNLKSEIALPIRYKEIIFGVLAIYASEENAFDTEETELLTKLANNLAYGIQTLRLEVNRKQAENELRRNQEILNTFVRYNPVPVAMFDRNMCYLAHSKRWISEFRLTDADIIGRSHYEVFPDMPEHWKAVHKSVLAGAIKSFDDELFHRADGTQDWVRRELHPWYDTEGNIGGIILFAEITTERRKAEEELLKYRNHLEELVLERTQTLERVRYDLVKTNRALKVLSQGNQALVHATEEQQLLDDICHIIVNIGNYRMAWVGYIENDEHKTIRPVAEWGYEEGYLKTLNVSWDDNEQGHGPTGTAVRAAKPSIARNIMTDPDFEPWREAAHKRGYASVAAFPLIKNKEAFGSLTIYAPEADAFDQEEINLLSELTNNMTYGILSMRAKKELLQKERLAVLGQLTATVSHELRNPLGTIRSSIYSLKKRIDDRNKSNVNILERVERNIKRCDIIIDELLDYSRARKFEFQATNINQIITEILEEYLFPDQISVSTNLASDIIINLDKDRFHRCLINILNNSCQSLLSKTDKNNMIINISTYIKNDRMIIDVTDNGPGIPTINMNKVFEPLYSTKVYGVGLGLPIVKQIMEQHHGGIDIISGNGEGITISLWLPVTIPEQT